MKGKISKKAVILLGIIAILVIGGISAGLLLTHQNGTHKSSQPVITLNNTAIEMDVTDTFALEATVENTEEKMVWTSEDESVATVSNEGLVHAVKEGQTRIMVSCGNVDASCDVKVTDSQSAPVIELDYNNVSIGLNYSFTVSPKVCWKGEEEETEVEYTWTLDEGAAEDVASIEQNGQSATITGLKYGDTAFTVSAHYRDTILVKKLNVCVADIDVMFESPNMEMSAGCYVVNLGLVETEKDITSIIPEINVYDEEKLVENPTFTWSNSDETIAVMDETGRITAKKAGITEITGMYEESPLLIKVNVYRTQIEKEPVYIEESKGYAISSSEWSGMEIEKVTFNEKDVLADYGNGSIQLMKDELPAIGTSGELIVQTDKVEYIMDSMVVTYAIYNESGLNAMPSVIANNGGAGYYALANDITCTGQYDSNLEVEFKGTFDGCGHAIHNMTTSDRAGSNRGLLGKSLGADGVVKNVAFVNAKHGGQGAFIATEAAGKIENVYVQIEIIDCTIDGYDGATSILASSTFGVFSTQNVLIEYMNSLPADTTTGYAVWQLYYGYAKHQGLYVVGADKAAYQENDQKGGLVDEYGAYVNYGEFADAGKDVSTWNEDFWTITSGIPYPACLGARTGSVPNVKLPRYVGTGSSVKLDGLTICDRVIVNGTMRQYGIKVEAGYLVIPENVPSGTALSITVQSAFDASKKTTIQTTILTSNKVDISKVYAVELGNSESFEISLEDLKELLANAELTDVTIDGTNISDVTYGWNKLELKTADLGELGEKTLQVYFKSGSELVIITVCVDACTLAIENEADLNKMASVIAENKGEGRYVLAADIKCKGTYDANIDTEFNGIFEGHGYTISNMTTADRTGSNRGLLGKSLGAKGVVRNVSFVNAAHSGQGAFIATSAAGTIENVYIQIAVTGCTVDGYDGATSVLASSTFGVFSTRNVIVEYMNTLADDASTGYAVWQLHYGYKKHQGLYVIGEDKVAAQENDLGGGLQDEYGAYINYGEYIKAGISTETWDGSFWNVTNNVPYPKRLGTRTGSVPEVSLPKYVGKNSEVKIDGLTICDQVVTNATMEQYGITVKNGYLVIPGTVPTGTTLSITVCSAFDNAKQTTIETTILDSTSVTISKVYAVELEGAKTFKVDLSSKKKLLKNAELTDITLAGKNITNASYKKNVLKLKTANIDGLGEKALQVYFKSGSKLIIVNVCIDACTLAIETEADLNKMASVIHENGGGGRYVLAKDIKCKGTYDANIGDEFNGIFEGHGYTIYNMTTSDRTGGNRGLLGASLGSVGTVKNVSFINAAHNGQGAFIATSAAGTIENVYIQIAVTGCTVDGYDGATSVLASSTFGVFNTRNVIVEYMNTLSDDAVTGYAVWQLHYGYAKHQGLYVIGEEKVAAQENDLGGGLQDEYGAYVNYGEYINAGISTDTWDSSFWNVTNNVPYPKHLGKRTGTAPKVTLPKYVGMNTSVKLDGLTICDEVVENATMKKYGITVKEGYLVIPKTVPSGTTLSITVRSAFDHSKKTTVKTTVLTSKKVSISSIYAVEGNASKIFEIDLSKKKSVLGSATLSDVTIAGKSAAKASYKNNILTLQTSDLDGLGEKTVQAYFKGKSKLIIVTVTVDSCTLAIETEADLNRMASVIHKNKGEGRYVLTKDIKCKGTYDANIGDEFNGTFEGHGYTIYNMTTSDREGANRGLLGASLGSLGTVKNVSFVNAAHSGKGAFIATSAAGTIENVYIQIDVTGCTADSYDGATSVLASSTFGVFSTKNVVVEYMNTLPDGATTGYAVWQLHYGYEKHQGLYVIGEEKVAAQENDLGGGLKDKYGAYSNYGDYIRAEISEDAWDSSFWNVTNHVPYPKHLGKRTGSVPNVSISEYTGAGSKVEIIGLTICDHAVLDSKADELGVKLNKNVITVPKNIEIGTKIKVTVSSAFDSSKKKVLTTKVIASKAMTLKGTFDVEKYNKDTFEIDFGKQADEVSGAKIISATCDGKAFTKTSYKNGILTMDTATLSGLGEKSITVQFLGNNKLTTVKINIDLCTMAIRNEEDLNKMAEVITANKGAGRYVLAKDIVCKGVYDSNLTVAFAGTFDGRGHVISNMTTSDREGGNRGLLGASLDGTGVVKNVSFVNAKHSGQGGFIVTSATGTIQDVYIQITVTDTTNATYDGATSVLASSTFGVFTTKNVLVEYANPLPAGAATGYAVWQLHYGYAKHQGLYVVGADKVASTTNDLGGKLEDDYAACMTYGDFVKAEHDVSGWDEAFWTVKNNIPYPKSLIDKVGVVKDVSISEIVAPGSTTAIEGATITTQVVLDSASTKLGIKVENNKLVVPANVKAGTVITMKVQSVFDTTESVKLTTKVLANKDVAVEGTIGVAIHNAETADIALGTAAQEVGNAELLNVTLEGKAFTTKSYEDGVLTIDTATFTALGEQTVVATFRSDNALITVSIPVDVCTMVIKTEADLNKMAEVITANKGDGRYILGNNIECTDKYDSNMSTEFVGTFDGRGYVISNMTTSARAGLNRGLLGSKMGSNGVVKNVSFVNAQHSGQGGFIVSESAGTIQDVYIQITITNVNNGDGAGATSVLASATYGVTKTKNVLVEYAEPLPEGATTGYAMGQLYYGYAMHQGLYVIGVDKVAKTESGSGTNDKFAAYMTYEELVKNEKLAWENDFWTMQDDIPRPKNLP